MHSVKTKFGALRWLRRWLATLLVLLVLWSIGSTAAWSRPPRKAPPKVETKTSYIMPYAMVLFVVAVGTYVAIRPGSRADEA